MYKTKTLLSMAVAASLGAVSIAANAAGPTVYGDIAVAFTYNTASNDTATPAVAGQNSSYAFNDNVSLLGVKGDAAVMDGTKFIYDFNFILNQIAPINVPLTHLSTIGLDGSFGTASLAQRENGLFVGMVDGGTYQTNWFYTPGMSSLQVSNAITYISKPAAGLQLGVQAFDIGKNSTSGKSTNNYTLAGSFAKDALTFGLGYTSYSKYGDGANASTGSLDTNQFGESTNTFAGQTLKNTLGLSAGFKADKFGVVGAFDMRKPNDGTPDTSSINTLMVTGSFSVSPKVTLVGNLSTTTQSDNGAIKGAKGNIITLMASYAPADDLFFSVELQNSNADANKTGVTGATGPFDNNVGASKSSTGIALGATYSF